MMGPNCLSPPALAAYNDPLARGGSPAEGEEEPAGAGGREAEAPRGGIDRSMLTTLRNRSLAVSTVVHAGLLGLLVVLATRAPLPSDSPLRVRLVEPSVPRTEPAPPAAAPPPPPKAGRETEGAPSKGKGRVPPGQAARPRLPERPAAPERVAPRGLPVPDAPRVAPAPPAAPPVSAAPPARLGGPPVELPQETARVAPREGPSPRPERGGLTLGGPPPGTTLPGQSAPGTAKRGPGRSIRDQLSGIGTGMEEELASEKPPIPLDSQDPQYGDAFDRIKQRIYREWTFPEAARMRGIGGEVLVSFSLRKSGTLTRVSLVRGSGHPQLDQEAVRAIKAAAPYDPFPPKMEEDPINILASFYYTYYSDRLRRN